MANQPVLTPIKTEPKFQHLQSPTVGVSKCSVSTYPKIHDLPAVDDGEDVEDNRVGGERYIKIERKANYIFTFNPRFTPDASPLRQSSGNPDPEPS